MSVPSEIPFHILIKPAGARCNLHCTYCFYLEKENLYPQWSEQRMNERTLENFIRQYIESQPGDKVLFSWQGGEPTLIGLDFYRRAIDIQRQFAAGKMIENTLQTNGILLDDEWCTFLVENDFLVGLSIDGPQDLHDSYRVRSNGQGSFKQVMRGLDYLTKHQVEYNTLTVIHSRNAGHPMRIYQFLRDIGSRFMQFIPIVERQASSADRQGLRLVSPEYDGASQLTAWSVTAEQYGTFLVSVFDEWVRNDVGEYFVQLFDVALAAWYGVEPGLCLFEETCGRALALEHNGDLYSCDHYVYPENKLGNILKTPLGELVQSTQQLKFGESKHEALPAYCRQCDVRFICNGECPKHRFISTPDGEKGLNYLCSAYKQFFTYAQPFMQFMANELKRGRPAANVVNWARERDSGFSKLKPRANQLCPCGSGKKYKKCCQIL